MLSFRIALRYLFSKKSHRAVNIISAISIAGVAVAAMAIVVVLSVFNGFSRLSEDQISRVDPDLRVMPVLGKTFAGADSLAVAIAAIDGVTAVVPVIDDRAMLAGMREHIPVEFKAVGHGYTSVIPVDSVIVDGVFIEKFDTLACMQLSVGVANRTGLRPSVSTVAELYVPRRRGRINPANPASSFRSTRMLVSGVLQVDRADVDNDRVVIPLDVARSLLDYSSGEASSLEVAVASGVSVDDVAEAVSAAVGPGFDVLDRHMQQADAFRMIEVEKWVTFMMLVFILLIASFNIISTLSLLVIEKRADSSVFRALGFTRAGVRLIFIWQGFLITVAGGCVGIVAGIVLSLAQQHFGLIKLAGDPAALTIDVYPVVVSMSDVAVVAVAVVVVAALISQITRIFTRRLFDDSRLKTTK